MVVRNQIIDASIVHRCRRFNVVDFRSFGSVACRLCGHRWHLRISVHHAKVNTFQQTKPAIVYKL